MSSVHPSLPSNGFYSFMPSTKFASNGGSQIDRPTQAGRQVRRSAVEDEVSGNHTSIQIWDVAKDRLLFSHPSIHPRTEARTQEVECCFETLTKVNSLFGYYKLRPIENRNHRMRIYLNEPNLEPHNAAWDPRTDSVLMDGSVSKYYAPIATIPDIIAHEFGHGFVYYHSPLPSTFQGGSLNEATADIIAIMTKHYHSNAQADDLKTNWEIGPGFLKEAIYGSALRSLKNPGRAFGFHPIEGSDRQIRHMSSYVELSLDEDWGGVHHYASIGAHAFQKFAAEIGGGSWEKAGCIWLGTLLNTSYTDQFSDFACRCMATVKALNYGPRVYEAVGQAWLDVGVDLRQYAYKTYEVESLTIKNLEDSMHYFGVQDFQRGLYHFDQACGRTPDVITSVYKNAWIEKGRPQNGDLQFGEHHFRGHYGPNCDSNYKAVEKFRDAMRNYETFAYLTPSQINYWQSMEKSIQNKAVSTLISATEGFKLFCRTFHLDFFGFR